MTRYDELLDSMNYLMRATADETPEDIWNDFIDRNNYNNCFLTDSNMEYALEAFSKNWLAYVSKSGLIFVDDTNTFEYDFQNTKLVQAMLCVSAWMKVKKAYDIVHKAIKDNYHLFSASGMDEIVNTFNETFTKYCRKGFDFGGTVLAKF